MHAARRGMRAAAEGLPRRRSLWHKTASPALRRARNRLRAAAQVVAATNIAETSVTIPGITYVIDSCFVKARARAAAVTPRGACGRQAAHAPAVCFALAPPAALLCACGGTMPLPGSRQQPQPRPCSAAPASSLKYARPRPGARVQPAARPGGAADRAGQPRERGAARGARRPHAPRALPAPVHRGRVCGAAGRRGASRAALLSPRAAARRPAFALPLPGHACSAPGMRPAPRRRADGAGVGAGPEADADCWIIITPAAPSQVPEMQRAELAGTVLQLKALGVDNIMAFDWLAPPPAEAAVRALELLHALGALGDDARCAPASRPPSSRCGLRPGRRPHLQSLARGWPERQGPCAAPARKA
jgi:hypothetical protein